MLRLSKLFADRAWAGDTLGNGDCGGEDYGLQKLGRTAFSARENDESKAGSAGLKRCPSRFCFGLMRGVMGLSLQVLQGLYLGFVFAKRKRVLLNFAVRRGDIF